MENFMKKNNCQFRSCQFKARVKFSQKLAVKLHCNITFLVIPIKLTASLHRIQKNTNKYIYIFGPPNRDIFWYTKFGTFDLKTNREKFVTKWPKLNHSFMYTRIRPKVERLNNLNFVTKVIEVTLDSLKIKFESFNGI